MELLTTEVIAAEMLVLGLDRGDLDWRKKVVGDGGFSHHPEKICRKA